MNKYAQATLKAVNYYKIKKNPKEVWDKATAEIFGEFSSQKKACPRSTFLSLCEVGAVKGIPKGNYAPKVKENKGYALKALEILKSRNNNSEDIKPTELWKLVQIHSI